jgi:transposase
MIRFPLSDLLSEQESYDYLMRVLHPDGLKCPEGHQLPLGQAPHDSSRAPIYDYKCRTCNKVFNLFTNTIWSKTHYNCSTLVLLIRGFVQGTPTLQLADELELDYGTILKRRHQIQRLGLKNLPVDALADEATEADEMFQNAGEKGTQHTDPLDPPRRRANKQRGHGTMDTDRPPILGVVGRTSGQIHLTVCDNVKRTTIQPKVENYTEPTTTLYTDESSAYGKIVDTGRGHATVSHSAHEWARDDDGDGIREVHCNTMEGIWTGLRNFLRPFRGVHKEYLKFYVAMFEWAHNLKRVTLEFLRMLMAPDFTVEPI